MSMHLLLIDIITSSQLIEGDVGVGVGKYVGRHRSSKICIKTYICTYIHTCVASRDSGVVCVWDSVLLRTLSAALIIYAPKSASISIRD